MLPDYPKHWKLVERKRNQNNSNKQTVYETLLQVGKPSTSTEIFNKINSMLLSKCNREFQAQIHSSKIPSRNNKLYWEKLWKENRITLRTVQRQLRKLHEEGYLEYHDRRYSFSSMEFPKVKLWAKDFGLTVLDSAMKRIFPYYSRLDYNLTRLIEIFGTYIVYCFIEATRPISNSQKHISSQKRDQLAISWVESMLDPRQMFYYFVTLCKTQLDDQDVRDMRKKIFRMINGMYIFRGGLEEYTDSLSKLMPSKVKFRLDDNHKKINDRENHSVLESDSEIVEKLKKILLEKYEMVFLEMEATYKLFDVKNKEGAELRSPSPSFEPEPGSLESIHGVWNSEILEKISEWDKDLVTNSDY